MAHADEMKMKAQVYKSYGDTAVTKMVLDSLPKMAREVSRPLKKVEDVVIIGGDGTSGKVTCETTKLLAELPVSSL